MLNNPLQCVFKISKNTSILGCFDVMEVCFLVVWKDECLVIGEVLSDLALTSLASKVFRLDH